MTTGNVVYGYAGDGNLYMLNADTGELLDKKFFGVPVNVAPTIGSGNDGKHRIGLHVGGGGGFVFRGHGTAPGTFATFGLPDELPRNVEAEVREVLVPGEERVVEVEREVERIVEVEKIVEVQVPGEERVVEVEVEKIVEVEKEVEVITTEEVISPISYVAIGLGVVLVVVSGVLYQRSKN